MQETIQSALHATAPTAGRIGLLRRHRQPMQVREVGDAIAGIRFICPVT